MPPVDQETLQAVKTALHHEVQEVLLPKIDEKITAAVQPVAQRVEAVERQAVRFDADGKRFKWAGGEAEAPAFLRGVRAGESKPLLASNFWRGVMAGGQGNRAAMEQYAPEELALSDRLQEAGYAGMYLGSVLFPLDPSLIVEPVDKQGRKTADLSALKKEIGERLRIAAVDPGELAWTLKRFPEFARELLGLERKDLQLGDDVLGGYLRPITQAATVFDLFRARATILRAGATVVPLPPTGQITYPRLTADPSFSWTDPDTTTDASTSNISLGVVRLIAKSLRGYVTIPNDLIRYSSPSVEVLVRAALAAKAAVEFDDAGLQAVGSSLQPKGLINYPASAAEVPAVGKITLHVATTTGANGDTFEPEDVMKNLGLYSQGDDPDPATGWIMRPLMWAAVANRRADAVTAGDKKGAFMFWTSRGTLGAQVPEALGGHPVFTSSKVLKTRTKGSGTDLTYTLFGNFGRLLVGMVGAIELAVSEHVKFLQDKTIIRAVLRGDTGPSHEQAFVFTDTLLES